MVHLYKATLIQDPILFKKSDEVIICKNENE